MSARCGLVGNRLFRALCLCGLAVVVACNGGNGGPGGTLTPEAVVVTDAVHLAPGVTSAALAWSASDGPVGSYLVFESRNGSGYSFSQVTNSAQASISGQAGDSVQITVVAVSPNGEMSDSSPPSPPVIFHAPAAAATRVQPSFAAASPVSAPDLAPDAIESPDLGSDAASESTSETDIAAQEPATQTTDEAEASSSPLARALRSLLLGGDARLPERGLSDHANRWLQIRVDAEIEAGVSLAGTGRQDGDALRELVWQDHAGQLFVSDGKTFIDAEDLPSTLGEAIRLRATERFVGLADFDGDERGDWLLEDTTTGDVWVVNGATGNLIEIGPRGETRLVGHGDFNGDGKSQIVWMSDDNRFDFSDPTPAIPGAVIPGAIGPDGFELLAIADLNGDGRDDLLGRGAQGGLVMAFAREDAGVEWRSGTSSNIEGLDLVATLDVDNDGRAEIAFLNGDMLEIWSAESGRQDAWEL